MLPSLTIFCLLSAFSSAFEQRSDEILKNLPLESSIDVVLEKTTEALLANNTMFTSLQMIDATGKLGSGILTKGVWSYGDFHQCQRIGKGLAKYCLYAAANFSMLPLVWGICVNSSLDKTDLLVQINGQLRQMKLLGTGLSEVICHEKRALTTFPIILIVIFSLIGAIVLFSTLWDIVFICYKVTGPARDSKHNEENNSEEPKEILLDSREEKEKENILSTGFFAFSMARNLPKLLAVNSGSKAIHCLHGIRAITAMWIVIFHSFSSIKPANLQDYLDQRKSFLLQAVVRGYTGVDTFFFLSGLLLMYQTYQRMEHMTSISSWLRFYRNRILRLSFLYYAVFLIYWKLLPYSGDGPIWNEGVEISEQNCDKYWWSTAFYISNFYPKEESQKCMVWFWYVSADLQMHIFSPIFLLSAYKKGYFGIIVSVLVAIAGVLATVAGYSIKYSLSVNNPNEPKFFQYVNFPFYTRASPFLIGLLLGYILVKKKPLGFINRAKSYVLWLCAFVTGLTVIYGLYWTEKGYHYPEAASVLYTTLNTTCWGLCMAVVVYLCHFGYGGVINKILSWKGWLPFSRLSYSVYLVHPVIILYRTVSRQQIDVFTLPAWVFSYVSVLSFAYFFGSILYLCIEYPATVLVKIATVEASSRSKMIK